MNMKDFLWIVGVSGLSVIVYQSNIGGIKNALIPHLGTPYEQLQHFASNGDWARVARIAEDQRDKTLALLDEYTEDRCPPDLGTTTDLCLQANQLVRDRMAVDAFRYDSLRWKAELLAKQM